MISEHRAPSSGSRAILFSVFRDRRKTGSLFWGRGLSGRNRNATSGFPLGVVVIEDDAMDKNIYSSIDKSNSSSRMSRENTSCSSRVCCFTIATCSIWHGVFVHNLGTTGAPHDERKTCVWLGAWVFASIRPTNAHPSEVLCAEGLISPCHRVLMAGPQSVPINRAAVML